MKPFVDIFVVGYDLPEIESKCLASVVKHTKWPYVLTFFDNYGMSSSLTEVWENFVSKSNENYIVLLNNDTEVHPQWLTRMMEVMLVDPTIGFCGPSTNNCHSPQKQIGTFELAEHNINQVEFVKDPLSGFCLLLRRKAWEDVGGFDLRYSLYGSESDLVDRAHKLGYKSSWVKSSYVFHHGELSIKKSGVNVEEERTKAKKLYWSERRK